MIDIRTQKQIQRIMSVVVDDSLYDADFEYVQAAIDKVRSECDKIEKYMQEIDKLAEDKETKDAQN